MKKLKPKFKPALPKWKPREYPKRLALRVDPPTAREIDKLALKFCPVGFKPERQAMAEYLLLLGIETLKAKPRRTL